MYFTISKRFELSFSHRCYQSGHSRSENFDLYGKESLGEFGHGHNLVATFIFNGAIEEKDGMVINVTIIKEKINRLLSDRYDHKFLNTDTKPFDEIQPTFENIAIYLLNDAREYFKDEKVSPVVCHIKEEPGIEAVAYQSGRVERGYSFNFSAARKTSSPNLSDEENKQLFGEAGNIHGHHYKVRLITDGAIDPKSGLIVSDDVIQPLLKKIKDKYDHKYLNTDVAEFSKLPVTTETLAKLIFDEINQSVPLKSIRLDENDYFFVEYTRDDQMSMGIKASFHAAHRLHSPYLNDKENFEVYGKCHNLKGHGHHYQVEILLSGKYDKHSGIVFDLNKKINQLKAVLDEYDYKHLDKEVDEFNKLIPTGENICHVLFSKLEQQFSISLIRLRLWETNNNRFTLRRNLK